MASSSLKTNSNITAVPKNTVGSFFRKAGGEFFTGVNNQTSFFGSTVQARLIPSGQTDVGFRGLDGPGPTIQRAPVDSPNAHVGGDPGSVTTLDDGTGKSVKSGQAYFSRRMLQETTGKSQDVFNRLYADVVQTSVIINNQAIDGNIKTRAVEKQRAVEDSKDFMHVPSTRKLVERTAEECQQSIVALNRAKSEENEKTFKYNAWVPSANGFYASMSRLEAMQEMLGVSDPARMVSALTQGLDEARNLGISAQRENDKGKGIALPVPPVDNSVAQASSETTIAAREMNIAYLDFQQNIAKLEIAKTNAEGTADRTRLTEINEIKTFVRNVGKTIDVTMSVVSGAPAAIANVTTTVQQTGASINAARNRSQIMAGGRPTYNPTFVTVDKNGQMVVRNMQTGMDSTGARGGDGKLVQTASPQSPDISLPSVSGALGAIADFAYATEVRDINNRLEQIKSRCDAIAEVDEITQTRKRAENFKSKLNTFSEKCLHLQQRIAQRRQDYLQFGIDLDNFARKNAAARSAGQAPAEGKEKFATIMTITSQVREALAIGDAAKQGIDSPTEFADWARGLADEREIIPYAGSYKTPTTYIKMGDTEWNGLNDMYGQVARFNSNFNNVKSVLQPIEAAAAAALGALHQGGGNGGVY
ncbi:MAG: hypothetical protein ABIQ31_02925 [Ferruginibacter sp.]